MKKHLTVIGIVLVMLAMGLAQDLQAQATNEVSTLSVQQEHTLWQLIKSGGWAMYPLGACSVLTVTLIIINFQRVNVKRMVPMDLIAQIKASAGTGDLLTVWNLASASESMFAKALAAGLKHISPNDPVSSRPKVEQLIAEAASQEETKYAFFVNFLALMTSMSPMWGLLGTVSGMIGAFSKIGGGGMGKPEMLAKNISEALVCTATGLMIAIIAMGFYFLFRNMLNTVMKESEKHSTDVLDLLTGTGNTFSAVTSEPAAAQPPAPKA